MNTSLILKGLDCPNCAAKIEKKVGELEGISSSEVNLMRQRLKITYEDDRHVEDVVKRVTDIVHAYEPDVEVMLEKVHHDHDHDEDSPYRLTRLIIGGVIGIAAICANYLLSPSLSIILPVLIVAYLILGGDVLLRAGKNIAKGRVFDENFLMALATICAFVIGEYPEAVAVMLLYQIGEYFQDHAVGKSRTAIQKLLDIRPDKAIVIRDGQKIEVAPSEVQIGEHIFVKPGERIPLDGKVIEGTSLVDTRALTGESIPREITINDMALSGCINQNVALTIEVTKLFTESTASKIINLVENAASKKAPAEHFITKFAHYYTPIVTVLALCLAIIPPMIGVGAWSECIRRACIFLVISCPCALVISVPLTFFGGIGAASRRGILVKGGNYLEALHHVNTLVFDKTGTLTRGNFDVTRVIPYENIQEAEVLTAAGYAECLSNHPIAKSIMRSLQNHDIQVKSDEIKNYTEAAGQGISVEFDGHKISAGNETLMKNLQINYISCDEVGTKIYIAKDKDYLGCIVIADQIRDDSVDTVRLLKKENIVKTVMLTGDDESIAEDIAKQIGLDEYHANLLPDQKVSWFEQISKNNTTGQTAFVGDGINDARCLHELTLELQWEDWVPMQR